MRRIEQVAFAPEAEDAGVEEIEISLLLEGIRLSYGYDFREYALGPLRRGILTAMSAEGASTVSAYQDRILHDAACMRRFLAVAGVNVTSFFRDADLMRCLRDEAFPLFRTYPSIRVWVAGCSTGEEVYTIAVLLEEQGILGKTSIYATDLNEDMLAVARTGSYPLDKLRRCEDGYARSGGTGTLSNHYEVFHRTGRFHRELQANVTWARHNLVSEASFNDFHLILCANVLIYFRPALQDRVHSLIYDSLIRSGFLGLGKRESLVCSPDRNHYEQVRDGVNLFRKTRW